MPRALDPNQRFPVVLESDKGKEPECTFWFKYLSGREFAQVDETARQIDKAERDVDYYGPVYSALRIGLVDWSNLIDAEGKPVKYEPANLECILDLGEALELLRAMRIAVTFGGVDAKKSESQPGSDSVASVGPGAVPAKPSRSKSNAPNAAGKAAPPATADTSA